MAQDSKDLGPPGASRRTNVGRSSARQLCMRRSTLDDLPEIVLPDGYSLRASQEGDGGHWARIVRESFEDASFDESRFKREMQGHPAYLSERIFFVCAADGTPCATASAYRSEAFGEDVGYLHMVGVCPAHTGRKIGFAVSLAALCRFRFEGLSTAVLQTDDFRTPAIKTYFRLGFSPFINHDSHPSRWTAVRAKLDMRQE